MGVYSRMRMCVWSRVAWLSRNRRVRSPGSVSGPVSLWAYTVTALVAMQTKFALHGARFVSSARAEHGGAKVRRRKGVAAQGRGRVLLLEGPAPGAGSARARSSLGWAERSSRRGRMRKRAAHSIRLLDPYAPGGGPDGLRGGGGLCALCTLSAISALCANRYAMVCVRGCSVRWEGART